MRWCWSKAADEAAAGTSAAPRAASALVPDLNKASRTSKLVTSSTHVIAATFQRKKVASRPPVDATDVDFDIMPKTLRSGVGLPPAHQGQQDSASIKAEDSAASDLIFMPGPPQLFSTDRQALLHAAPQLKPPVASAQTLEQTAAEHGPSAQQHSTSIKKCIYWEEVFLPEGQVREGIGSGSIGISAGSADQQRAATPFDLHHTNIAADGFTSDPADLDTTAPQPSGTAVVFESMFRDDMYTPAARQPSVTAWMSSHRTSTSAGPWQIQGKAVASSYSRVDQVFVPLQNPSGQLSCTIRCAAPPATSSSHLTATPAYHHQPGNVPARLASPLASPGLLASVDLLKDDQGSECNSTATVHLATNRHSTCTSEIHAPLHRLKDSEELPLAAASIPVLSPEVSHVPADAAASLGQRAAFSTAEIEVLMPTTGSAAAAAAAAAEIGVATMPEAAQIGKVPSTETLESQPRGSTDGSSTAITSHEPLTLTVMPSDDLGHDAMPQPRSKSMSQPKAVSTKVVARQVAERVGSVDTELKLDAVG